MTFSLAYFLAKKDPDEYTFFTNSKTSEEVGT
jgi:hypothetical protein